MQLSQIIGLGGLALLAVLGFWLMRPPKKQKPRGEYRGDDPPDSIGGGSSSIQSGHGHGGGD